MRDFEPIVPKTHRFDAVIEEGRGGGAFVTVPFDVEKVFGTRGQVKVKARFDTVDYRGSLAPMGGQHILGIRKSIRQSLGKKIGDTLRVVLERDTEARTVTVPPELKAALEKHPEAKARFESLSYTRRREYAEGIAGAKKDETRKRRIQKAIEELRSG